MSKVARGKYLVSGWYDETLWSLLFRANRRAAKAGAFHWRGRRSNRARLWLLTCHFIGDLLLKHSRPYWLKYKKACKKGEQ